jgi:hypothetical protein
MRRQAGTLVAAWQFGAALAVATIAIMLWCSPAVQDEDSANASTTEACHHLLGSLSPELAAKTYSQAVEELSDHNVGIQPPPVRCPAANVGYLQIGTVGHIGTSRFVRHPSYPGGDDEYFAPDGRLVAAAYYADIPRHHCGDGISAYATIYGVIPEGAAVVDESICVSLGQPPDPP